MNEHNPLTQIKNDVENKRLKKYQQIKEKNTVKHYELYLNKIILIQKFWRNHLTQKSTVLQKLTLKEINNNIQNKQKNENLRNRLQLLKKQRYDLENFDPNQQQVFHKKELEKQLKLSLKNVFEGADRYAKIKAVLKSQMMSYQQIVKENQSLKISCQKNSFQVENMKQKNKRLLQKIKTLKYTISDEKTEILLLKQKNNQAFQLFSLEQLTMN